VSGGGGLSPTIQVPTWGVSAAGAAVPTAPSLSDVNSTDSPVAPGMDACRARVLYDYDAADIKELSLIADEVINVYRLPNVDDWMMGERGSQRGKVPVTYIELL